MPELDGQHTTDEQWIALISLINNDDERWQVSYPTATRQSVRGIDPDGKPFVIKTNGEVMRPQWNPEDGDQA